MTFKRRDSSVDKGTISGQAASFYGRGFLFPEQNYSIEDGCYVTLTRLYIANLNRFTRLYPINIFLYKLYHSIIKLS